MQITLMRHGRPLLTQGPWLAPYDMAQWIARYDAALVHAAEVPAASHALLAGAVTVTASTAPRAISSVQALGRQASGADPVFGEAQLPHALWRFPRLPGSAWAAFFRLLWLAGYARGADSLGVTRLRARTGAHRLAALARNGPVLLVGHGIMNHLIGKELLSAGWVQISSQGSRHWGASVYRLTPREGGPARRL